MRIDLETAREIERLRTEIDALKAENELLKSTLFPPLSSAGRYCLSEDDCIAEGIRFGFYEKGVSDAIDACEMIVRDYRLKQIK